MNFKRDLEGLKMSELRIEDLSLRMQDVAETNRLLSLELEDKSRKFHEAAEMAQNLLKEKEIQENKLRAMQENSSSESKTIRNQKDQINKLERDVAYLSMRQIDPSLESTVFSTQKLIRDSLFDHTEHSERSPTSNLPDLPNLLSQSESLLTAADNLVARTADVVVYFERSAAGDLRTTHCRQCNEEISFLILTNSRIALEFRQAYNEIKKSINMILKVSTHNDIGLSASYRSFNPSPPNLKTSFEDTFPKSTSERLTGLNYDNNSQFSSSRGLTFDILSTQGNFTVVGDDSPRTGQDFSTTLYNSTPAQLPHEPQAIRSRDTLLEKHAGGNVLFQDRSHQLMFERQIPKRDITCEPVNASIVLQDPTPVRKADTLAAKKSPVLFGSIKSESKDSYGSKWDAHSSYDAFTNSAETPIRHASSREVRAAISTPNQKAAQASIMRLSKLGSEIDMLQSKLDEIDGKRKSKFITRMIQH